jgi:HlyD family secretion protein
MSERLSRKSWFLLAGAIVLALLAATPLLRHRDTVQYLTTKVQKGEIRDAVDATGTVNAVINVQVGSQVSGTIAKLNADFNSRVHKGEIIAEIDPRLLQGALLQAAADLENAKANVVAARANLNKSKAALVQTKADFERARVLAEKSVGSQQALDVAKANYDSARAAVDSSVASITQAEAEVRQKEAAVAVSRTNLNYAIIRSPIDGTVVARNVDVGQTVAASLQAPTIFTIAQDLAKMQVYAKVDESDVGRIRTGQLVSFKVDAFPKQQFQGTVSQIRMNPTTVQNVVTYDAIIDFANPELKLFPGMTAYVTIPVATAEDVVKLPNAALRFRPPLSPEAVRALYAKFGIDAQSESAAQASATAGPRKGGHAERAVVWKLLGDGSIEPVEVALGITDHAYTELTKLLKGDVKAGDEVVTSSIASKSSAPGVQGIRR